MARRTYQLSREIAERLNAAREQRGMTIKELARAAMVNPDTVVSISQAQTINPGVGTLADLAKALGVPRGWLAYGE